MKHGSCIILLWSKLNWNRCIYVAVNFYISYVSNSLVFITIPPKNRKIKINWDKKLTTTYMSSYKWDTQESSHSGWLEYINSVVIKKSLALIYKRLLTSSDIFTSLFLCFAQYFSKMVSRPYKQHRNYDWRRISRWKFR